MRTTRSATTCKLVGTFVIAASMLAASFAAAGTQTIAVRAHRTTEVDVFIDSLPGYSVVMVTDEQLATPGFLDSFDALYLASSLSPEAAAGVLEYLRGGSTLVLMNSNFADEVESDPFLQSLIENAVTYAAAAGRGFIGELAGAVTALTSNADGLTPLGLVSGSAGPFGSGHGGSDGILDLEPAGIGHPVTQGLTFPVDPAGVDFGAALQDVDPGLVVAAFDDGFYPAILASPVEPLADLSITKDDGQTSAVPGELLTYTVTAANAGPTPVSGATVRDLLPASLTCEWTCVAAGGAACTAGPQAGDVEDTVDLPVNGSVTYTAECLVDPLATGRLRNTAVVALPPGTSDPDYRNNHAVDVDTFPTDLAITKQGDPEEVLAGTAITYTLTVTNSGPGTMIGAAVSDFLPPELTSVSWICIPGGGARCRPGSGLVDDLEPNDFRLGAQDLDLENWTLDFDPDVGDRYVNTSTSVPHLTVLGTGDDSFDYFSFTVAAAGDRGIFDADATGGGIDAGLTVYDAAGNSLGSSGGSPTTYGQGGSTTTDDPFLEVFFPAPGLYYVRVTSSPFGDIPSGAFYELQVSLPGHPLGSPDLDETVDLPPGGLLAYTVVATIDPAASGSVENTASVTVPAGATDVEPSNDAATDVATLLPPADLSITKDDGVTSLDPGQPVTYTLTVTNHGPGDAAGATVSDAFAADLLGCTWTCSASPGSSCEAAGSGDLDESVDLLAGGTATFLATCTVSPSAADPLVNVATVAAPADSFDPDPSDNSAADLDTFPADLSITKSSGQATAVAGTPLTYTVVVTNEGPANLPGARVVDVFPPQLTEVEWTCTAAGGAACESPGLGLVGDLEPNDNVAAPQDLDAADWALTFNPNIGSNSENTSTSIPHLTVLGTGNETFDNYSFTVASPGDRGIFDVDFGGTHFSVHLLDSLGFELAQDVSSPTSSGQGGSSRLNPYIDHTFAASGVYVLEVGRWGPGVEIPIPAGASYQLQISLEGHPLAAVDIDETVDLPAGGTLTYVTSAVIDPGAGDSGTVTNTATVSVPPGAVDSDPSNDSATDVVTLLPPADLEVAKDDGLTSATPEGPLTYTVTVTNHGPGDVAGATVSDDLPDALTGCTWSCSATAGSSCSPGGSGDLADAVDLVAGGIATYLVSCTVSPQATGMLVNTAGVSGPLGALDPEPGNDSATDVDFYPADLEVTKDDGRTTAVPGTEVTYAVEVINHGPGDMHGATVLDALPPELASASWSCASSGGAVCEEPSSSGTFVVEPNGTQAEAQDLDAESWSLAFDPDIGDRDVNTSTTLPHLTVFRTGGYDVDNYSITVAHAGDRGIFDVDYGNLGGIDTTLRLFDDEGNELAFNDNSQFTNGAGGSISGRDSYFDLYFPAAGVYVVEVYGDLLGPPTGTVTYRLQVSVEGHPVAPIGLEETAPSLPAGSALVYTITGIVDGDPGDMVVNTATVTVPPGAVDSDPSNDAASDVDLVISPSIFLDGFESGNVSAWSSSQP